MAKHTSKPREQQQRSDQHIQQENRKNRQQAEQEEVAGRHKNDGQKDHKGAQEAHRKSSS